MALFVAGAVVGALFGGGADHSNDTEIHESVSNILKNKQINDCFINNEETIKNVNVIVSNSNVKGINFTERGGGSCTIHSTFDATIDNTLSATSKQQLKVQDSDFFTALAHMNDNDSNSTKINLDTKTYVSNLMKNICQINDVKVIEDINIIVSNSTISEPIALDLGDITVPTCVLSNLAKIDVQNKDQADSQQTNKVSSWLNSVTTAAIIIVIVIVIGGVIAGLIYFESKQAENKKTQLAQEAKKQAVVDRQQQQDTFQQQRVQALQQSQTQNIPPPPTQQANIPPPIQQANIPPPTQQANIPPPTQQANIPPPTQQANIPPAQKPSTFEQIKQGVAQFNDPETQSQIKQTSENLNSLFGKRKSAIEETGDGLQNIVSSNSGIFSKAQELFTNIAPKIEAALPEIEAAVETGAEFIATNPELLLI